MTRAERAGGRRLALCAALVAVVAAAGCKGRKRPPDAAAFSTDVIARRDCLHHAVAAAALSDGWLVITACGGGEAGHEELVAARLDDRGGQASEEPVHILSAGWATNVLTSGVPGGGAIVAWTSASGGEATAFAAPVDVQGRPTGVAVALGPGRALGLAGGPGGAAVAIVSEPETLSDDVAAPGGTLTLVTIDADAQITGKLTLSRRVGPGRPWASVAAAPRGYAVAWIEAGVVRVAAAGPFAEAGAHGIASPAPARLELPPVAAFTFPAVLAGDGGAARVAAIVSTTGEVWVGDGEIGGDPGAWRWRPAASGAAGGARRAALAAAGEARGPAALAWLEGAGEASTIMVARLGADGAPAGSPEPAVPRAVIFDGPVALAARPGLVLVAGALAPSADDAPGAVRAVQLLRSAPPTTPP